MQVVACIGQMSLNPFCNNRSKTPPKSNGAEKKRDVRGRVITFSRTTTRSEASDHPTSSLPSCFGRRTAQSWCILFKHTTTMHGSVADGQDVPSFVHAFSYLGEDRRAWRRSLHRTGTQAMVERAHL